MEKAQVTQVFNSLTISIENNEKPLHSLFFLVVCNSQEPSEL